MTIEILHEVCVLFEKKKTNCIMQMSFLDKPSNITLLHKHELISNAPAGRRCLRLAAKATVMRSIKVLFCGSDSSPIAYQA